MPERRFPPPWSVEDIGGCFVVKASNDRPMVFIYYGEDLSFLFGDDSNFNIRYLCFAVAFLFLVWWTNKYEKQ